MVRGGNRDGKEESGEKRREEETRGEETTPDRVTVLGLGFHHFYPVTHFNPVTHFYPSLTSWLTHCHSTEGNF